MLAANDSAPAKCNRSWDLEPGSREPDGVCYTATRLLASTGAVFDCCCSSNRLRMRRTSMKVNAVVMEITAANIRYTIASIGGGLPPACLLEIARSETDIMALIRLNASGHRYFSGFRTNLIPGSRPVACQNTGFAMSELNLQFAKVTARPKETQRELAVCPIM